MAAKNYHRPSFRAFIRTVNPKYQFYRHTEVLIEYLQKIADGEIDRLMVFMPPRHSKSETISRLFTAYYLYVHPYRWVGLCSYGAELANGLSRVAQEYFVRHGGKLDPKMGAVNLWGTRFGGGMWSAGVGGAITGRGFHLGIVDDPIKNAEEAHSPTIREKQKQWWDSTFSTRAEPGAAIVVVQTRWHEEDLSGYLLSKEDEEPEGWTVINMPALAEPVEPGRFPESCTVTPDYRRLGEPLCPERYPLDRLVKIRSRIGSYFWSALYQNRPAAPEGAIFKNQWWRYWHPRQTPLAPVPARLPDGSIYLCPVAEVPALFDEMLLSWDMAFANEKGASYVVGQVWGRLGADKYLLDQVRGRMEFTETLAAFVGLVEAWPDARVRLVENKANGPAVISALRKKIAGIVAVEPEGSKEARARAVSPDIESGNVYLPHPSVAPWVQEFLEEARSFPFGAHDDQVDAMTQALRRFQAATPEVTEAELAEIWDYLG